MRKKTEARVIKKLGSQPTRQSLLAANGSTFVSDWNKGRTFTLFALLPQIVHG